MFDVSWKPKNYEERVKNEPSFGSYHHYSTSTHEDAEGFCEWLRYKGNTDIKITEIKPYTKENIKKIRNELGLTTDKNDERNINIVNNLFDSECYPGNVPYTFRKIMEIVEKCGIDIDKPIILESNGLYAIEHIYRFEDGEGEYEALNDCLVIDICG